MRIKINLDMTNSDTPETSGNNAKITAALVAVNGKATSHTYASYLSARYEARNAEERLIALGIAKSDRRGARLRAESGEKLPTAYKREAITTVITIERGSSHWYLTAVQRGSLWPGRQPKSHLMLNAYQDVCAVDHYRDGEAATGHSARWHWVAPKMPEMQATDLTG